jgi:thiamine biosynthesis lipoprotein ApbE
MLENIDMEKIKEYSKQVNETFEYLDKNEKLVEELSNIAKLNNPSVNKLMKALEQEAVLDINKNGFKTKKK